MKYLIFAICLMSCSSWKLDVKTSLDSVKTLTDSTASVVDAGYRVKCRLLAIDCANKKDTTCQPLVECHNAMRKAIDVQKQIYELISQGYGYLLLDKEALVRKSLTEAVNLFGKLK